MYYYNRLCPPLSFDLGFRYWGDNGSNTTSYRSIFTFFLRTNQILSYFSVWFSEYGRDPPSMHGLVETSSHRLEQMMSSNKRWLEKRKKDTNMYPFSKLNTRESFLWFFLILRVEITSWSILSLILPPRPLFTRFPTPLTESSKVQLGLDDNNEIRVYYYWTHGADSSPDVTATEDFGTLFLWHTLVVFFFFFCILF